MADRRRLVALVVCLGVALAAGGCGVSGSSGPEDMGDGLAPGVPITDVVPAPRPDLASSPEKLVRLYLKATAGGGDGSIERVKRFLTGKAAQTWSDPPNPQNPQLTVVRLVGGPVKGASTGGRTPLSVSYQVVGTLNDQGRVNELVDLVTRSMTFWVVPAEDDPTNLRIEEIAGAPPGLLLSDEALTEYYRTQPVYFWDAATKLLVPDLRYLPLTVPTDQRATKLVQWLCDGPSSWLTAAQRLPTGTNLKSVVYRDETYEVNLTAQAGASGEEGLKRLYFQLQWSLRSALRSDTTPRIELQVEGQKAAISVALDEYERFNQSSTVAPAKTYDIVDGRVVEPGPRPTSNPRGVLAAAENQSVAWAAVDRDANLAAFVRTGPDGKRSLQIVRDGAATVESSLPRRTDMGRPVWIPGTKDQLLITSDKRLYVVSVIDGRHVEVPPKGVVGSVTGVAVAPDGRRVAFVAGGQAYVASLSFDGAAVTVGSSPRPILAAQLTVAALAWQNESWLYVAGTASGGAPAMWHVTADSVVGQDESSSLGGVTPVDMVAHPTGPFSRVGEVIVHTAQGGVYTYGTTLTSEPELTRPFYAG